MRYIGNIFIVNFSANLSGFGSGFIKAQLQNPTLPLRSKPISSRKRNPILSQTLDLKHDSKTKGGPYWKVPTGRRDGVISRASEALSNIPAPTFNFTTQRTSFAKKGLNVKYLVLLSGAHTIGIAHCSSFNNCLYHFTGVGDEDPSLDRFYAANLKKNKCKTPTDNTTIAEMDSGSFRTFDLDYFKNLVKRRGLFQSDAALITNSTSKSYITELLGGPLEVFLAEFAMSMEKMGRIGVKTGSSGQIRKKCDVVNS